MMEIAKKLLVAWVGVLFAVALAEVGLRLVRFPHRLIFFHQHAADLGLALRPGAHGWFRGEAKAFVRIDREGLRGPEYTKQAPANTLRVAVLGDSMTVAMSVPFEDTFCALMERDLGGCPALGGRRPQVMNFGVNGYGTAQELIMLRDRVWQYSPNIVVLAFFSGNDVRSNYRPMEGNPYIPYFVLQNGKLVADDSFSHEPWFRAQFAPSRRIVAWLTNHFEVLELIDQVRSAISGVHRSPGDVAGEAGLDDQVYLEAPNATWRQAWAVTDAIVTTMNSEVVEHGAKFLLVTLSNGIQVYPDAAVRARFMKKLGVTDLLYPERRLQELGERAGFPVLNLAPIFQEYADRNKVFLHGFAQSRTLGSGHWNQEGNRLAGRLIAQKICAGFLKH